MSPKTVLLRTTLTPIINLCTYDMTPGFKSLTVFWIFFAAGSLVTLYVYTQSSWWLPPSCLQSQGPNIWNSLPKDVISSETLLSFKRKIFFLTFKSGNASTGSANLLRRPLSYKPGSFWRPTSVFIITQLCHTSDISFHFLMSLHVPCNHMALCSPFLANW